MVTCLQEVYLTVPDEVDDAVFLCQPSRPNSCQHVFERLGFSNAGKWLAHQGLDEVKRPDRDAPIFIDPKAKILDELGMKYCQPLGFELEPAFTLLAQVQLPCAG